MRTVTVKLESASAYSQSKAFEVDRLEGETPDAAETRTWRQKCHVDPKTGNVFIPPMAFTLGLQFAAKRIGKKIPGAGNKTYAKMIEGGVMCTEPVVLPIKPSEVACERVHVNVDGVRGSGKRVFKNYPRIDEWKGTVTFHVLSDELPEKVFEDTLTYAGLFAGIGRFRPEKGGYLGRFTVKSVSWGRA